MDEPQPITQREPDDPRAYAAWAEACATDHRRRDDFTNVYLGHYASIDAYVDELADEVGLADELAKLPDSVQPYVRYYADAVARDLQNDGGITSIDDPQGGVWLFQGASRRAQ